MYTIRIRNLVSGREMTKGFYPTLAAAEAVCKAICRQLWRTGLITTVERI